jgi:hypothetical protein
VIEILFFGVPFLIVMECMACFVATGHTWLSHRCSLGLQAVTFAESGITDRSC